MMQPTFMPWLGYFELICKSDIFIILDDFQFTVQSWQQRNRMFVNKNQVDWYTIPIDKSKSFLAPLDKTIINESVPWRKKMLKRIRYNYSGASFFPEIFQLVERWLLTEKETLAEQNIMFIRDICDYLGINPEFRRSSDFPSTSKRSMRVLELLRACRADHYYCARGSFGYMQEDAVFPVNGIDVLFQNFQHKPYIQVGSPNEFVAGLSVIDALMNTGPKVTYDLIKHGTEGWLTWDEMKFQ